jgi:dolichyl-phosphate-mannose-protein mannosyltransferase
MRDKPYVSQRETAVLRFRYLSAFVLFGNATFLAIYTSWGKAEILRWAANRPDPIDSAYYKLVFSYLETPIFLVIIISGLMVALAPFILRRVRIFARSDTWFPFLLAIIAALQITIALTIDSIPHSDSVFFIDLAERLAETGSYANASGTQTAFWPVGYPAVLAAIFAIAGKGLFAVQIFHIIVYLAIITLLYATFRRSERRPNAALVLFTILYAFHPNGLLSVNAILAEFPFMLLIWGSVFLLLRENKLILNAALAGLGLALAAYFKPLILVLVVVIALYFIFKSRDSQSLARASTLMAVFIMVLVPWTVRNYLAFDALVPVSTNGGLNFFIGNNPKATGKYESVQIQFDENMNEAKRSHMAWSAGLQYISRDPVGALSLLPRKIFYSFWRGDASLTWALKTTKDPLPKVLPALLFYFTNMIHYMSLFGIVVVVFCRRWFRKAGATSGLFILLYFYFIFAVLMFFGSERFMAPVMPIPLWFLSCWLMGSYSKKDYLHSKK